MDCLTLAVIEIGHNHSMFFLEPVSDHEFVCCVWINLIWSLSHRVCLPECIILQVGPTYLKKRYFVIKQHVSIVSIFPHLFHSSLNISQTRSSSFKV